MRQLKLPGREGVVQVRPGPPAFQRHALDSRERPRRARAELKARGNQTAGKDRSRREAGKETEKADGVEADPALSTVLPLTLPLNPAPRPVRSQRSSRLGKRL